MNNELNLPQHPFPNMENFSKHAFFNEEISNALSSNSLESDPYRYSFHMEPGQAMSPCTTAGQGSHDTTVHDNGNNSLSDKLPLERCSIKKDGVENICPEDFAVSDLLLTENTQLISDGLDPSSANKYIDLNYQICTNNNNFDSRKSLNGKTNEQENVWSYGSEDLSQANVFNSGGSGTSNVIGVKRPITGGMNLMKNNGASGAPVNSRGWNNSYAAVSNTNNDKWSGHGNQAGYSTNNFMGLWHRQIPLNAKGSSSPFAAEGTSFSSYPANRQISLANSSNTTYKMFPKKTAPPHSNFPKPTHDMNLHSDKQPDFYSMNSLSHSINMNIVGGLNNIEKIFGANPLDSMKPSFEGVLNDIYKGQDGGNSQSLSLNSNHASHEEPFSMGHVSSLSEREERFSRKVFVGGLPPDIDEQEITNAFRRFGMLVVDWPHKAESKSYFPPKGYCFLLFQEEISVQYLINSCIVDDEKYYWCVSSPTIRDKPVQIRPWSLADSDYVMDDSQPLDPRKTIFVGGVPRPLKAVELAFIMNRFYGGVCYAGIDTDPELKYPKGAGRVAFSNQHSYITAISARFVQLQYKDIEKRVEVKPYVLDDQFCDECFGAKCGGKFAPYFCANVTCLQYYCETCWAHIHNRQGREYHKPLVKEGADRPRTVPFRW